MKIGIIGLGLMGGSFSIEMRRLFPNSLILGNDTSQINIKSAKRLELIDDVFEIPGFTCQIHVLNLKMDR